MKSWLKMIGVFLTMAAVAFMVGSWVALGCHLGSAGILPIGTAILGGEGGFGFIVALTLQRPGA